MSTNLIDTSGLDRAEIIKLFQRADFFQKSSSMLPVKTNQMGALLFFESSTRTRVGFEAAAWKLGIKTILIDETKLNDKMSQPESITDTIKTLNAFVNFFCIRHPSDDIFEMLTTLTELPIINCGNGSSEHPTQALIDAYALWTKFGDLDGLNITIIGNPAFTRSTHSLIGLLSNFKEIQINEVCEPGLKLGSSYVKPFTKQGNSYNSVNNHIWGSEQAIYVTGFPPITPVGKFSQKVRDKYKISLSVTSQLADGCIILCPLPRIDEIDEDVDQTKHAYYFNQNQLGLYMRMAILEKYCLET